MGQDVNYDPFAGGELETTRSTTEAERELWLVTQLSDGANCAYNSVIKITVPGHLDPARVGAALAQVAARHASLRTTFSAHGTVANVAKEATVDFLATADASDQQISDAVNAAASAPLSLLHGPLWRCLLFHSQHTSTLVLVTHHIISDGWSNGVLLRDISRCYSGVSPNAPSAQDMAAYQVWERADPQRGEIARDVEFWRTTLAGHVRSPGFPSTSERNYTHDFACHYAAVSIQGEALAGIQRAARQARATLNVYLTTAFAAYLSNTAGEPNVVLGIPTAGQLNAAMADLVGHCVNTLPVRLAVDATQPFSSVLGACKPLLSRSFDHNRVTFGTLLKEYPDLRRNLEGPLVPVMFNVESGEFNLTLDDLPATVEVAPRHYENFDFSVNCVLEGDRLEITAHANAALYDERYLATRLAEFSRFAQAVAGQGQTPVRDIDCMDDVQHHLLQRFNATGREIPYSSLVVQIEHWAVEAPDRVCFVYDGGTLTYGELWRRSADIAGALLEAGVSRGDPVGVAIQPGLQLPAALLACFRAGACYLPIDNELPPQRACFMLNDARAAACLVDEQGAQQVTQAGCAQIHVDTVTATTQVPGSMDYPRGEDAAYVIYTSGSTGEPKGVQVRHDALHNFLQAMIARPGFEARDVFLWITTVAFDIAALEIWLPQVLGARCVIADRSQTRDGHALTALIREHSISVVQATPSSWNLILRSGLEGAGHIKALAAGEPVTCDLLQALLPRVKELWNGYGPTEATVFTTLQQLTQADAPIAIGTPVANSQVHIVSATGYRLPPGLIGEICIAGRCLAAGYVGREQLTAQRFEQHAGFGQVIYHAGDLGYIDPDDGLAYCLGRVDEQVKIRGYRIELEEISTVFCAQFDVAQALAVVVRQDQIAVVYSGGECIDTEQARGRLRAVLPAYMLPNHVIQVEALEQTPNGKINKRHTRHRAEAIIDGLTSATDAGALSELQQLVLEVIASAVQTPGVRLTDDFFAVGGHSLTAMNVTMQIAEILEIPVELSLLFDFPILGEFVQQVEHLLMADIAEQAAR